MYITSKNHMKIIMKIIIGVHFLKEHKITISNEMVNKYRINNFTR